MGLASLKMEDLPHYTYDDYVQWEGQWELLKGIPYAMVPAPVLKHQDLSLDIAIQLKNLLAACEKCHVYEALDWQIEEKVPDEKGTRKARWKKDNFPLKDYPGTG